MLSSQIDELVEKRERLRLHCERVLIAARNAGREHVLPAGERAFDNLKALDSKIAHLHGEYERGPGSPALRDFKARINQSSQHTRNNSMSTTTAMRPGSVSGHLQGDR